MAKTRVMCSLYHLQHTYAHTRTPTDISTFSSNIEGHGHKKKKNLWYLSNTLFVEWLGRGGLGGSSLPRCCTVIEHYMPPPYPLHSSPYITISTHGNPQSCCIFFGVEGTCSMLFATANLFCFAAVLCATPKYFN